MLDAVLLEVLHHRFESVVEEMEMALLKSSFSVIIKEVKDCSTAIFNAQGQNVAQALAIPAHLGTMLESVPQVLKAFPVSEMQEGDIFIANDPYSGGTHLPDITVMTPVVYQGEILALAASMVHHQDIGAMTPGVPTSATSIYQEGLNIPPVKLFEAGKPVKAIHDIIRKNVRIPDIIIGDIMAQVAAGNVGKLRVMELFDYYGKDTILAAMKQLQDHSEALTRLELEKIPDGCYSFVDYLDNDGVDLDKRIKLQAKVIIRGDELIVDCSDMVPQVRGPINAPPSSTLAVAAYVTRVITGASIPTNAGCYRPISLNLPEGSLVNPHSPAPVGARSTTIARVTDVVMGALVQVIPEHLPAASPNNIILHLGGFDPLTGGEYVTSDSVFGGLGARPSKDGVDAISTDFNNALNVPVESVELNCPLRVLKHSLRIDSGGAGEYRGGLGAEKVWEVLRGSVELACRGERFYTQCWGLFGGLPSPKANAFIVRSTGEVEEIPSKVDAVLNEGDQLHAFATGGGGYGDPLNRKPELVLLDVLDKKVSLKAATEDYGVVIDQESMTIKFEETGKLREKRRKKRGPITWTYDRGPELGRE